MPRNSNQQYSIPAGTLGEPNTKISSSKYNAFVQDIESDLNTVRPIDMVGTGITIYKETRSALYSDLDYDVGVPAVVYGDSDRSYRGVYTKNGASGVGSWSQVISYLPGYQDATAVATAIGGTANAITAMITGYPDPDEAKILILVPSATNTDTAVTVNINGAGSVAIKNAAGNALAIGDLVADVGAVLFKDPDNIWRQLASSRESATLDYQGVWSGSVTYTSAQFVMSGSTLYYLDDASSLNDDPASGVPWVAVFDFGAISGLASENVEIIAGPGLSGGGDLTANRTLSVDEGNIDHNALGNFSSNKHINHASVNINAGTGLSGGGNIAASRTLNVDSASPAQMAAGAENKFPDAETVKNFVEGNYGVSSRSGVVSLTRIPVKIDGVLVEQIIQTGSYSGANGSVVFPLEFPNVLAHLSLQPTYNANIGNGNAATTNLKTSSTAGFSFSSGIESGASDTFSGADLTGTFYAVGY